VNGISTGWVAGSSVRRIAISNSVFDGTDRGIRLKSTRGRGGVVEDVRVSNVVMKDIREEALTLNLFYSDAPAEPVSDRTPRFKNVHVSGVTGSAKTAALLLGLEEAPLEDVTFSDVRLKTQRGFLIQDARGVRLESVRIDTAAGPAVVARRSERLELAGVTGAPHAGTPLIDLGDVKRAFVHGCFAETGTDVFVRVFGANAEQVVLDGNELSGARTPLERSNQPAELLVAQGTAGGPPPLHGAARPK